MHMCLCINAPFFFLPLTKRALYPATPASNTNQMLSTLCFVRLNVLQKTIQLRPGRNAKKNQTKAQRSSTPGPSLIQPKQQTYPSLREFPPNAFPPNRIDDGVSHHQHSSRPKMATWAGESPDGRLEPTRWSCRTASRRGRRRTTLLRLPPTHASSPRPCTYHGASLWRAL